MCTVEYILESLLFRRLRFHVESVPVNQVFHQGKGEETGDKKKDTGTWCKDTIVDGVS